MPGMGTGSADPAVVAAFRAALLRQGLIALVIVAALAAAGYLALVKAPAPETATAAEAPPYVRKKS